MYGRRIDENKKKNVFSTYMHQKGYLPDGLLHFVYALEDKQ